jgi:hypothetical protein
LLRDSVTQIIGDDDHGHLRLGARPGMTRVKLDDLQAFVAGSLRYVHGTLRGGVPFASAIISGILTHA